jgi:Carboxypeptidase regulatory-like domain
MRKHLQLLAIAVFVTTLCGQLSLTTAQDKSKDKVASFKGRVFRSDTKQSFPNAQVVLTDEKKSEKRDNSQETHTDAGGNFSFDRVVAGKYTLTIRAEFEKEDDVPCRMNLSKLSNNTDPSTAAIAQILSQNVTMDVEVKNGKDKMLISVKPEDKKFIEQIQIKGLTLKASESAAREFDLVCPGLPK